MSSSSVKGWLGFCALGVVLALLVDRALLTGLRRIENGDFGVWNALVKGRLNAEVLIVGGSRALVDVDCTVIGPAVGRSCFNIGLDGSPHNLQLPQLEAYLTHNKAPRVAIISADISSLASARGAYKAYQYLPYLDEAPLYANLKQLEPDSWKDRYIPLYGFARHGLPLTMSALHGLVGRADPAAEARVLGQFRVDILWDGAFDNMMREVGSAGKVFPIEPEAEAIVAKMVRTLEERGTRVAVFYSPEWREMHRFELNRDQVISRYRAIATENGARFLDYSDSPLGRERAYFYNSQHMNRTGAALFSRDLARDLAALDAAKSP